MQNSKLREKTKNPIKFLPRHKYYYYQRPMNADLITFDKSSLLQNQIDSKPGVSHRSTKINKYILTLYPQC